MLISFLFTRKIRTIFIVTYVNLTNLSRIASFNKHRRCTYNSLARATTTLTYLEVKENAIPMVVTGLGLVQGLFVEETANCGRTDCKLG